MIKQRRQIRDAVILVDLHGYTVTEGGSQTVEARGQFCNATLVKGHPHRILPELSGRIAIHLNANSFVQFGTNAGPFCFCQEHYHSGGSQTKSSTRGGVKKAGRNTGIHRNPRIHCHQSGTQTVEARGQSAMPHRSSQTP